MIPSSRLRRRVHAAMGIPAYLLLILDWRVALGFAALGIFFNLEVLPRTRLGQRLLRPSERRLGGVGWYPITVAILIMWHREQAYAAAAGWLTMAFGDASASYVGERAPLATWPYKGDKTVGGSLGFVAGAFAPLVLLGVQCGLGLPEAASFAFVIAVAGALLEVLPLPIDDNPVVGIGAGVVARMLRP